MVKRMDDVKRKRRSMNKRASRKELKAEIIEGKNRREQRPQRSSHGACQQSSSSSLSFNMSNNVAGDFPTHAISTKKEGAVKQRKGSRLIAKKLHKSKFKKMKKAKKMLEKKALEVAEKRGEIKYIKQLQMEELAAVEAAAIEIQPELTRRRAINQIEFVKNICIQQFVDFMLHVFEAQDNFN